MTTTIKRLSSELINKIAAGEVVERPASVVKELLENSLDAGASSITLEIENGGLDKIRVIDDGKGMTGDDAIMALDRHTTSKIDSYEDLYKINSFGFRGEAIASIASVSKFKIETKTEEEGEAALVLPGEDGKVTVKACAREKGTTITVNELFYNVPARKKFLKTASTEYNNIIEIFNQFSVMNYAVSWKLIHNDKVVTQTPKVNHWQDRVKQVFGKQVGDQMIDIQIKGEISLEGFVGKPETFRSSKKHQFTYVNGRPVHDYMISKAVSDSFSSLIKERTYPIYALNIIIPTEQVDVNVHPRKIEVKFEKPNEVYKLVRSSIKNALVHHNVLSSTDLIHSFASKGSDRYEPVDKSGLIFKPKGGSGSTVPFFSNKPLSNKEKNLTEALNFTEAIAKPLVSSEQGTTLQNEWKLIGQVHKSYLIVETPDGFMVIDQHAAAERLNYEKFTAEFNNQEKKSQKALIPINIELTYREKEILTSAKELLEGIGFEIEDFGEQSIVVQSIPQDLAKADIEEVLKGIIDDLDGENISHLHSLEEKQHVVIKYAACRGAIMFNDLLSQQEQLQLLNDIQELSPDKYTCCHGRPFMKEFQKTDLEKLFERH